jgi:hypothetical protein
MAVYYDATYELQASLSLGASILSRTCALIYVLLPSAETQTPS